MCAKENEYKLTGSLEDYLETIFELVRDKKFARVKDIAKARGVKAGSVSPAMRRLADLGLIKYMEREYIDLTPAGEVEARRIYAKHQLLTRFFTRILKMSRKTAEVDACAIEHNLSNEVMDHIVRFFEFLQGCPEGEQLMNRFRECSLVHDDVPECKTDCPMKKTGGILQGRPLLSIWELGPGEQARVCQILGTGDIRQHLLEKGIMPDVPMEMERTIPKEDKALIKLQGFQLSLERKEAESVMVVSETSK
jgi:DtxR family Mn-dependent transcriptional regulator